MTALLDGIRLRSVGPIRGGRSVAATGHPTDRLRFWFGSTGGGVWQTDDAGRTWRNISDGFFRRASVGAIAVSTSDPSILYVGMGECCIRNTVSHGDGVYRSADGGRTWHHCGLAETRNIGRIRIDPRDPERAYVAALGHAHGPNPERGVYRTRDGGRSWDLVLHRDQDSGAVDLDIDPFSPRILYATTWQARRLPWRLDSGGPGSGLWRSDDGGDTWTELSRRPGMPDGVLGRIGITASRAQEGRLWAIVEAEKGGVYRSDDRGEHWVRLSEQHGLRQRPFYYSHIVADPCDAETVWVLATQAWRSIDGGRTFATVEVQHGDCHDLWIDPTDPRRLILADDGGANVSLDGGASWSSLLNQPTAELYHVTADTREPYRLYSSQQDNSSVSVPSHAEGGAIDSRDMYSVGGGECGYIAVRPDNPDIVFASDYNGELTRYDHRLRAAQHIWAWPDYRRGGGAETERYRFNWTTPILISPHDPGTLYQAGNVVFRSRDDGQSWEPISPDLSRNDPEKLRTSGGPITQENGGAEYWCTVFTLAESPLRRDLLWAGTDDGRVHVTEDGGEAWREVTPPDLPEWATVSIIEPSPHDLGTAWMAVERHRLDDMRPHLFVTEDLGATWRRIDGGLPQDEFCRVIREDPVVRGLLYVGTEAGLWMSPDGGATWHRLRGSLPTTPVHDLLVKDDDLVVCTHGRGLWILDDLPAVRAHADDLRRDRDDDGPRLYPPAPLVRWATRGGAGDTAPAGSGPRRSLHWTFGMHVHTVLTSPHPGRDDADVRFLDAGENTSEGAVLLYVLPDPGDRDLELTVTASDGTVVRRLRSTAAEEKEPPEPVPGQPTPPRPPRRAGLNRFVWDARHEPMEKIAVDAADGDLLGDFAPWVLPGTYTVTLRLGDHEQSAELHVALDPRMGDGEADLRARHELIARAYTAAADLNRGVNRMRRITSALGRWLEEGGEAVTTAAREVKEAIAPIEDELTATDVAGLSLIQVLLSRPARVDLRLARVIAMLAGGWGPVQEPTRAVAEMLTADVARCLAALDAIVAGPLARLETAIRDSGAPAIRLDEPLSAASSPGATG